MNSPSTKSPDGNEPRPYEVGYGKPPAHARFRKGVSGNPSGGSRVQRARALALKEAYRMVTVREGDNVMSLPAAIHAMEQELAAEAAAREKEEAERPPFSYTEAARRVSLLLRLAYEEKGEPMPGNLKDAAAGLIGHDKAKTGG
jgi:Family of unknown function (DUF5681)